MLASLGEVTILLRGFTSKGGQNPNPKPPPPRYMPDNYYTTLSIVLIEEMLLVLSLVCRSHSGNEIDGCNNIVGC